MRFSRIYRTEGLYADGLELVQEAAEAEGISVSVYIVKAALEKLAASTPSDDCSAP